VSTTHFARFEGGSYGGRVEPLPGLRPSRSAFYVPVLARRWLGSPGDTLPFPSHDRDEYRWEGERRYDSEYARDVYIYRWVRPNVDGLLRRIRQLDKELHELKNPIRKGLVRFVGPCSTPSRKES
jgi:hypothetical protein